MLRASPKTNTTRNLGNLREANVNGTQITYAIDPQDRRIGRKENGQWTHKWIYQDGLNPIAELDEQDRIRKAFVYADKGHVPSYMLTFDESGTETGQYRIVSDLLGSVRVVYDLTTGNPIQQIDYDVWGNITNDTNPDFQPFGFAGGLYDQTTKLTRFGARDYDAETGRWTAKDPIGFNAGDVNLYGYVANDPVNSFDPSGFAEKCRAFSERKWLEISRGWKIDRYEYGSATAAAAGAAGDAITSQISRGKPGFGMVQMTPIMKYIGLEQEFDMDILECWDECTPSEIRRSILKAVPTGGFREVFYQYGEREGSPVMRITGQPDRETMNSRWFSRRRAW